MGVDVHEGIEETRGVGTTRECTVSTTRGEHDRSEREGGTRATMRHGAADAHLKAVVAVIDGLVRGGVLRATQGKLERSHHAG